MPKIVSGLSALVLAVTVAAPATAAMDRHYMGSSCNYEFDNSAPHKRELNKFVNTSDAARWVVCPVVGESNVSIKSATMDFKTPVTDMKLSFRQPDGWTNGWLPEQEIYINNDGSLRRAVWFTEFDALGRVDNAWGFTAKVGAGAFIMKYGMEQ